MDSNPRVSPEGWRQVWKAEYLADYLRSGGSAVKVLSGSPQVLAETVGQIRSDAESGGYFYAHCDAGVPTDYGGRPDLHRIDRFFFSVTRDVDWKAWAAEQARQYLQSQGIHVAPDRALGDLERIAEDNARDPQDLMRQYQSELATPQIRDPRLALEFRSAVTALSRSILIPDAVTPTTEEVLLGWFAGESLPGATAALKKIGILERINLSNARAMLASFCRWLPHAGWAGLVVTLDFRPYEYKKVSKAKRQQDQMQRVREAIARGASAEELAQLAADESAGAEPEVFYSDAAYMQMLTLIRRFIDEIDAFERFSLILLTSPQFYRDKTLDPAVKRCYFDYDALQTRIGQEVHDARYANPAASLIHLQEGNDQ